MNEAQGVWPKVKDFKRRVKAEEEGECGRGKAEGGRGKVKESRRRPQGVRREEGSMATADEIMEGLEDFKEQCNSNKRLRRMQRDWSKVLHYSASDTGDSFTTTVLEGEIIRNELGKQGTPDVVIETDSETLCDMFWGDINPTQKYLKGEIKVKGSQEDVMRIDAITAVIWPEV